MIKIEMRQASRPLSEVARRAKIDPIVAVKGGGQLQPLYQF